MYKLEVESWMTSNLLLRSSKQFWKNYVQYVAGNIEQKPCVIDIENDIIAYDARYYDYTFTSQLSYLEFKNEADATAFILRWS